MYAHIYRPASNPMQSGPIPLPWKLEFVEDADAGYIEPLMGWTGNAAPRKQIIMRFASQEDAESYARRHEVPFKVTQPQQKRIVPKSYVDTIVK